MRALFITGTGTDIGKTYVSCALVRVLKAMGRDVDVLKPVVSGFDEAAPEGSDPVLLLQAMGVEPNAEAIAEISPWRYRAPLAANLAARAENARIDHAEIVALCKHRMAAARDVFLIEGAGGVMSPLADDTTYLDLIVALGAPILLVAGTYLGAISHALTAQAAIKARGLKLSAVVLSESGDGNVGLDLTRDALAPFTSGVPIVEAPRHDRALLERGLTELAKALL